MGKSENGAIWLDEEMLSNYHFWQFWRNTEDKDVIKFLKLFTELNLTEINKFENLTGSDINEAKIILANEVTKLCRGEEAASKSAETALDTFSNAKINENLPLFEITEQNISIIDALKLSQFSNSRGEARRLIRGKGAKLNDKVVTNEEEIISKKIYKNDKIKISAGKKRHALITFR